MIAKIFISAIALVIMGAIFVGALIEEMVRGTARVFTDEES